MTSSFSKGPSFGPLILTFRTSTEAIEAGYELKDTQPFSQPTSPKDFGFCLRGKPTVFLSRPGRLFITSCRRLPFLTQSNSKETYLADQEISQHKWL